MVDTDDEGSSTNRGQTFVAHSPQSYPYSVSVHSPMRIASPRTPCSGSTSSPDSFTSHFDHDPLFSDEHEVKSTTHTKLPITSFALVMLTVAFFLYGCHELKFDSVRIPFGWGVFTSPIPNDPLFLYSPMTSYPSCTDIRGQWWRLFLYQFSHGGCFHLVTNQLSLLCYGGFLEPLIQGGDSTRGDAGLGEILFGSLQVLIAFQSAVVLGALANAYDFGYTSLVGNSGGVYGLIGLGWGILLSRRLFPNKRTEICLAITLVSQLLFDVCYFLLAFSPGFAYLCHFSGFVAGLGSGLLFGGLLGPDKGLVRFFSIAAGGGLVVFQWSFLIYHYLSDWPPQLNHLNPFFGHETAYVRHSCCLDAYTLVASMTTTNASSSVAAAQSWDAVRSSYYCGSSGRLSHM